MNSKKLHYYELWTGCHAVAPFVMKLAKKVYPNKRWRLLKGRHHTVVIDDPLTIVMDILNFKEHSARWSLNFALEYEKARTKKYFSGLSRYVT